MKSISYRRAAKLKKRKKKLTAKELRYIVRCNERTTKRMSKVALNVMTARTMMLATAKAKLILQSPMMPGDDPKTHMANKAMALMECVCDTYEQLRLMRASYQQGHHAGR